MNIILLQMVLLGCETKQETEPQQVPEEQVDDTAVDVPPVDDTAEPEEQDTADTGEPEEEPCEPPVYEPNPFATSIVSYNPGTEAGFGQDSLPDIVLGPPLGAGENSGSLDVLTLGNEGEIILAFDVTILNGDGPDVIVYENPFIGFPETGVVSASVDGETWYAWPCDAENDVELFPGCAGVTPSLSHPDNCIDATDPEVAGGDHFDLADIGLETANYIRVQDSGFNEYGGFDLDAIAIIHREAK